MIFLDTNYLIRFLTKDIKTQSEKAKKLIEKSKELYIPIIVLAETIYILEKHYKADKNEVVEIISAFIKQPNIFVASFITPALEIYASENISFYDCILVSEALEKKSTLKSFDEKLIKIFSKYKKS